MRSRGPSRPPRMRTPRSRVPAWTQRRPYRRFLGERASMERLSRLLRGHGWSRGYDVGTMARRPRLLAPSSSSTRLARAYLRRGSHWHRSCILAYLFLVPLIAIAGRAPPGLVKRAVAALNDARRSQAFPLLVGFTLMTSDFWISGPSNATSEASVSDTSSARASPTYSTLRLSSADATCLAMLSRTLRGGIHPLLRGWRRRRRRRGFLGIMQRLRMPNSSN